MTKLNTLDIVIVNYNSHGSLHQCLKSLELSIRDIGSRIIVIDNASKEDVSSVTTLFSSIEVIKNKVNIGFASAVNQGIQKSTAPYLVVLNPDTIIQEGFFKKALEFMELNPDVGIIGPKIMNSDGSIQGSARTFPTPLTAIFGRTSLLTRVFPRNPISRKNVLTADAVSSLEAISVDWVSGACMIVRRDAIEISGLLDERFFMYWEDADWSMRMRDNGWKVMYYPAISITHHVGKSSKERFLRSTLDFHWSAYKLYRKYTPAVKFIVMQPILIPGLIMRCVIILFRGPKH